MQISSVDQGYLSNLYANSTNKVNNSTNVASSQTAGLDTATISNDAQKMPPPPHEMDFESISDDDLKDYLQQMYNITGTLPGGDTRAVDSLSDEDLAQVRGTLVDMSQNSPVVQMMASNDASALSGEDFKTLFALFMANMQSGMTGLGGDASSSDDLLFSSGDTDIVMQTILTNLMNKMSEGNTDEEGQSQAQQAIAAYVQNMTTI